MSCLVKNGISIKILRYKVHLLLDTFHKKIKSFSSIFSIKSTLKPCFYILALILLCLQNNVIMNDIIMSYNAKCVRTKMLLFYLCLHIALFFIHTDFRKWFILSHRIISFINFHYLLSFHLLSNVLIVTISRS